MSDRNADGPDGDSGTEPFDGSAIDRRTFVGLAAATGAALSLPGTAPASGQITDPRVSDVCQYVINNTPDDYETELVVEFADDSTADWFDTTFEYDGGNRHPQDPEKTVIRYSPTPAGHGLLTTSEVSSLLDEPGVDSVEFSPGANPFWKLQGGYDDGVFPEFLDSRDYLAYDEVVAGVDYLESQHPDRVNDLAIGQSPGWFDKVDGTDQRWDVHVTEVTNDVDDDPSFADKEKVAYSLSIHGDERAGIEGGIRLIEDIVSGDAPEIERLLDDIVLLFVWTNPDGWVSREPWTEVDTVGSHDRNFQRGNGGSYNGGQIDTNRQYPTIGWVNPGFLPAEPDGAPGFFSDEVPDALSIVDHFRGYENVALFSDYHGMYDRADHMVYYLESNGSFDHAQTHLLDELSRQTGQALQRHWFAVKYIGNDIGDAAGIEYGNGNYLPGGDQFNGLLDWGTVYDTIGYQVSGGMMGWAGSPESAGGLGAVAVSPEVIISNNFPRAIKQWKPWWSRRYATAYQISMREYAKLAAVDTDATIGTGHRDTAYVATEKLTRSSDDLPFTGEDAPDPDGSTTVRSDRAVVGPTANGQGELTVRTDSVSRSLFVQFADAPVPGEGVARLVAPDGTVHERVRIGLDHGTGYTTPEMYVASPAAGEWTVEVDADAEVTVRTSVLDSPDAYPDPRDAWRGEGFQQTAYEVNPMGYFEDLKPVLEDGSIQGIDQENVTPGSLEGYDQLVVSHDDGIGDPDYVDAIDSFVADGGDLVLTDAGVHLLGALDAVAEIEPADVDDTTTRFAVLEDQDLEHPLLDGIRDRQQELYKGPQIGYTSGVDQPATVVDSSAFDAAGGEIAGEIGFNDVGLGRITVDDARIDCIGSVLPPAQQEDVLHPFGMADHAVSMMGHTVLCNALDFEQRRFVAGEMTRTFGPDWRGVENTIGDVDRDDEVSIVDAVRIQRQLAQLDPGPFDPELADVERDGELTIVDAVRIQRLLAQIDEPGDVTLVDTSASVDSGTLTVQADVENTGDLGAIRETEYRLAENQDNLDEFAVIAFKAADPAGNSSKTVSATIETTTLSPGTTYHYSVQVAGQEETGTVTVPSN